MFTMNLAYKNCIFNQQYLTLSCIKKLFIMSFSCTQHIVTSVSKNEYIRFSFPKHFEQKNVIDIKQKFNSSFTIIPNIVSEDEELQLTDEIEKSLKRLRYQYDHWDNAIHGYRETEMSTWKDPSNARVIQRLKNNVFSSQLTTKPMERVHILDLCDDGFVKPHVDSIRFCGNIIAGLSLLSDSVMRLVDEKHPDTFSVYIMLPRRSLYIMKDDVRYQYTHEILIDGAPSVFSDRNIIRRRRVSIVMRNEPPVDTVK